MVGERIKSSIPRRLLTIAAMAMYHDVSGANGDRWWQVQYFKQRRVAEYEKEQLLRRQEAESTQRR